MMLRHLGETDAAQRVEDAVLVTLEEGSAVTLDVARQTGDVEQATSTTGFTDAIIANLGRAPAKRFDRMRDEPPVAPSPRPRWERRPVPAADTSLVGVDVYVEADEDPSALGRALEVLAGPELRLLLISSRGTVAYPADNARIDTVAWWRCRFVAAGDAGTVDDGAILRLLARVGERTPWMHVQKLRHFGEEEGYTRAQGQ
jgi:isocitrate dehydrogenase